MPLTKLFKDTVKARVERDPAFGAALFQEALSGAGKLGIVIRGNDEN